MSVRKQSKKSVRTSNSDVADAAHRRISQPAPHFKMQNLAESPKRRQSTSALRNNNEIVDEQNKNINISEYQELPNEQINNKKNLEKLSTIPIGVRLKCIVFN